MAEEATRSRLGRGLAALIGDAETPSPERGRSPRRAGIDRLHPNPRNPRRVFADAELDALAESMRAHGVIQPIVVRPVRGSAETYEIIAGERRWRAAQRAGLHEVPIVVLDIGESEALELAIIENVQRVDLDPLEEAAGYQALIEQFGHGQEEVARIVGKSRSHIANTLRLLRLPEDVKAHIHAGRLSAGHARMLVGHPRAAELAAAIIARGLNVRQVEALTRREAAGGRHKASATTEKDADTRALEKRLADALGLKVTIEHRGEAGVVQIHYRDLEQLDLVLRRLQGGP
jgi:ParB family chromosome partitioning protein